MIEIKLNIPDARLLRQMRQGEEEKIAKQALQVESSINEAIEDNQIHTTFTQQNLPNNRLHPNIILLLEEKGYFVEFIESKGIYSGVMAHYRVSWS